METIGSYLKQQRERAGMSLEQVAKTTKIRGTLLTSLEADRMDDLPGGVFVRGFVRAYADAIRVRSDRAMELLDGQVAAPLSETRYSSPLEGEEAPTGSHFKPAHLVVLVAVLMSLIGGWYAFSGSGQLGSSVTAAETTDVDSGTTKSFSPRNQTRP